MGYCISYQAQSKCKSSKSNLSKSTQIFNVKLNFSVLLHGNMHIAQSE